MECTRKIIFLGKNFRHLAKIFVKVRSGMNKCTLGHIKTIAVCLEAKRFVMHDQYLQQVSRKKPLKVT